MCVSIKELAKKYSIRADKLLLLADFSGAMVEGDKICGDINEDLIRKYFEIKNALDNDEIVPLDDVNFAYLFPGYNVIRAYKTLHITSRVRVPGKMLERYPEIKRTAIYFGNTYYIPKSAYFLLKKIMQKEKKSVQTIEIEIDDTEES